MNFRGFPQNELAYPGFIAQGRVIHALSRRVRLNTAAVQIHGDFHRLVEIFHGLVCGMEI